MFECAKCKTPVIVVGELPVRRCDCPPRTPIVANIEAGLSAKMGVVVNRMAEARR